jgi:hypothetical protein
MTDSDKTGRLDYPREGFAVFWDERGLDIKAVEYHAESLHLSWETVLDLTQRAEAVNERGSKIFTFDKSDK